VRFSRKTIISVFFVIVAAIFISTIELPYYVYKPGRADSLETMVVVEDGYESEGSMHLLTVTAMKATPLQYIVGKVKPFYEITPIEAVRIEDETDEEYKQRQLYMMEESQNASTIVAYEAADADIEIIYNGAYVVNTVKNMPADDLLEPGDVIKLVDHIELETSNDLVEYVAQKEKGDVITIKFERDNKEFTEDIEIVNFPNDEEQFGVGIQLTSNVEVHVDPKVEFSSGQIGGPSAGLMFALKIYDQLVEEDLTKGKKIAGTGQIDYEGNVLPIGGADKKVVAADREGSDVFFVPYEQGREGSNYEEALQAAEKIKTNMDIVPVDTFEEALLYLENIE